MIERKFIATLAKKSRRKKISVGVVRTDSYENDENNAKAEAHLRCVDGWKLLHVSPAPDFVISMFTCLWCKKVQPMIREWQKFCCVKCRNDHFWATHRVVKVDGQGEQLPPSGNNDSVKG